jgi:hypothetical protein
MLLAWHQRRSFAPQLQLAVFGGLLFSFAISLLVEELMLARSSARSCSYGGDFGEGETLGTIHLGVLTSRRGRAQAVQSAWPRTEEVQFMVAHSFMLTKISFARSLSHLSFCFCATVSPGLRLDVTDSARQELFCHRMASRGWSL